MDEEMARELISDHFAWAGRDEVRATRIYADEAVLEFPQGEERIRAKDRILAMRAAYPANLGFTLRRTTGCGNLWVNEYTIRYDGRQSCVIGIMEFRDGKVIRETVYVGEPWEPPEWRAGWVESITTPAE